MDSKEIAKLAIASLEEKKAEEIKIIDITEISTIADYFIIASGNNKNQVQAIVDEVQNNLGKNKIYIKQIEGYDTANWVLMDYGDIIVHIFDKENRLYYDLDRIWRDGKLIDL